MASYINCWMWKLVVHWIYCKFLAFTRISLDVFLNHSGILPRKLFSVLIYVASTCDDANNKNINFGNYVLFDNLYFNKLNKPIENRDSVLANF